MNWCLNEGRDSGERMDSRRGRMRMDLEGDRLSSLSDDLIHKILSFVGIKQAIETSGLSSRWRFIWTSMPYLNFSTHDFPTLPKFSKFATNVLSHRNNLTEVHSLTLNFRVKVSLCFVKRILKYAFSHNIQQLNVVCWLQKDIEFPLSIFSSRSLKHLSLEMNIRRTYLTSTWELPMLTTLDLHSVTLCDDEADKCVGVFSKCVNLQNLILDRFKTTGSNGFSIIHPRLSSLTLENSSFDMKVIKLTAPQLKNLTIRFCYAEHVITAPDLVCLLYKGSNPLHLSTDEFHSLQKADICVSRPQKEDAHQFVSLLQQIHNVHFLTLSLETVEILFSFVDLILQEPSPFMNLKSVTIYPERECCYWKKVKTPTKVKYTKLKSYFLDSSPGSTFTMVLPEENEAQIIMAELGVILEEEKDNINTIRARLERGKAKMESHEPKVKLKRRIVKIKSDWEKLGVRLRRRKKKACLVISKFQDIEELLRKLPASKRSQIQACFSSLCAEADNVISQITDCMKMHCDESQALSSVFFHQLATTLKPPS